MTPPNNNLTVGKIEQPTTIMIWHRDGIAYNMVDGKEVDCLDRVYRNGELAITDGQDEHIVIVIN